MLCDFNLIFLVCCPIKVLILKADHIYAVCIYAIQQVEPEMENIICSLVTTCCQRGNAVHADVVRTTKIKIKLSLRMKGKW